MSRRDDVQIHRGKANRRQSTGAGIESRAKQERLVGPEIHPISVSRGVRPRIGVCAMPSAKPDASHAGHAVAGVAKTSPYIEEASR
jgi:hypothetical protein